jgi:uncharacterized membrane protein (Fun14 family)
MVVNTDTLTYMSTSIGGGFFGGLLIGYALKKVIKMLAVLVGLFLAGLAFLQYQQIATIHWSKLEGAITKLAAAATTSTINDNSNVAALCIWINTRLSLYQSWKNSKINRRCLLSCMALHYFFSQSLCIQLSSMNRILYL